MTYPEQIACAVMLYNRSSYTLFTLDSLLKNFLSDFVDWYFFIDGPRNKKDEENVKRVKDIADKFPYKKSIVCESENRGIPHQKNSAHNLFHGYEQVIFFEDDMIVSPYYIHLMLNMQEQFPCYLVYAPARPIRDNRYPIPEDAELDHIAEMPEHLWGYSLRKEAYFKIEYEYQRYVDFFKKHGIDYHRRPHNIITKKFGTRVSSHDAMLDMLFTKYNIPKIGTVIPRGKYIGEMGIHSRPEAYKKQGFRWLPWYHGDFDSYHNIFRFYHGKPIGVEL